MKKKGGKMVPNCVPEEFKVEEYITEEDDTKKLENELKQKENEIAALKQKAETDKAKNVQKSTDKMVNPETGEPLLQVGIAYKHLKDKMAKEKAAEADRKEKKSADMKARVAKLKDKLKESALNESDASDKAKSMGLDYMKFGRYGKDGKVTHKSIGGNLTPVDKDGEPIKSTGDKDVDDVNKSLAKRRADDKSKEPKQEPAPKPKIDKFDAQKDLEKEVSDGMIDVEDDGEGGLSMTKEYEPSQDYQAERDSIAIKDYLMDKGIDEDDIYIDVEGGEDDEYLQINVQVRGQKSESVMPKKKKVDVSPEHDAVEKKEDADYLKPRLNPSQIANIKKTWQDKKPGDVTPAVKKMIKNMDIPTQLAIKHANIKFLSGLVEGKFTRYSDLLIQLGRMKQARDKQGEMLTKKEIEKEKRKLGIKEDLNKDDEKVIKKVKDMLKGASAKHAAQAKMIDKALKNEADLTKSQIKKVHDKADDLPKKDFRDRYGKEKGDSVRYGVATKMVKKKLNIENKNHPSKELYETIKGLKNKADKSGMPYSILKKVYDRGMAAWRGGHRPGTSQQQWAFARVNSFVTKSSGTWGGADKDLAKQVRGSK